MATWALFLTIITLLENTKGALLKNAHIKYVSADKEGKEKIAIASSSFIINFVITITFIALILLLGKQTAALFNTGKDLYIILSWFIPGLLGMIFFAHLEAVQQSHFDFKGPFAGNITRQISFFIPLLLHFLLKKPIEIYLLAIYQSISILIGTVILFVFSRKYLSLKFHPSWLWVKKINNYGGYIFGTGVISNLFTNLDQFMTAAIIPGSVAYYNAAKRINGFIDIPTYAAAEIIFPKMSQASSAEGIHKVKYLYEKMVSALLSIVIPVALFVVLFPKLFINIIAGAKYISAAPILQAYMIISILGVLQHQAATTLYSIGKTKLCFIVSSGSLIFSLGITFIGLNYIGFYGAAIGSLITSSVTSCIWYFIMQKEIGFTISNIPIYCKEYYRSAYNWMKNKFFIKK